MSVTSVVIDLPEVTGLLGSDREDSESSEQISVD